MEHAMPEVTDEFMREMLATTKGYSVVLLRQGPQYASRERDAVVWEHGRRNFSLRAEGSLAIVCPVVDDSTLCGVALFDATPEDTARLMDDDPGVRAGVFEYEVHPVRSFAGDRLPD